MTVENIAAPVMRLPFVNTPTVYLRDAGMLAAVNYSGTGRDCRLFLIDIDGMCDHRYPLPEGERGAYGLVRGTDGRLYLGTHTGRIYAFDFQGPRLEEVARPFTNGQMVWGGGVSSSGKVYMGVYPTGEFCEFNPASGTVEVVRPIPNEDLGLYATSFVELPDKTMLIVVAGAQPGLFVYDPSRKECSRVYAEDSTTGFCYRPHCFWDSDRLIMSPLAGEDRSLRLFNWRTRTFEPTRWGRGLTDTILSMIKAESGFYATGYPSGRFYQAVEGDLRVVQEGVGHGHIFNTLHHVRDDRIVALSDNGLFVKFDLTTGLESSFQVRNQSDTGMRIQFLSWIPGTETVVGSHYICMQMFRIKLQSHECESSLEKISGYGGQVNCGVYLNGTFYLASYVHAVLYAMDPAAPFQYGKNPRMIGTIGKRQYRPVSMVTDGHYVYIATKSEYGTVGGAVTVLDPNAETTEVYPDFVADQNPTSLFYHGGTGCLVGTTETFGDCRTRAPRAERAAIFLWDPKSRKTVHTSFPLPAESLAGLALSTRGVLIGFHGGEYFLFDVTTRECEVKRLPFAGVRRSGVFMDEDTFVGATADALFELDIRRNTTRVLAEATATDVIEKLSDTEILFTHRGAEVRRLRYQQSGQVTGGEPDGHDGRSVAPPTQR